MILKHNIDLFGLDELKHQFQPLPLNSGPGLWLFLSQTAFVRRQRKEMKCSIEVNNWTLKHTITHINVSSNAKHIVMTCASEFSLAPLSHVIVA